MAIIYSYPIVDPSANDLVLGSDVDSAGKPTKNFTVQSIIDLVTVTGNDLQAVLDNGNTANSKDIDLTNNNFRGGGFITTGNATISGTTGTGFTSFSSTAFVGTLSTAAQPNITSLGTLTSLKVGNATPDITSIVTSFTAPGDDVKLATTKAIVDYIGTNPPGAESLAATLLVGNTTGGTDIAVSAGDDVTFTDTSKIIMGTGGDFEIYHGSFGGSDQSWIRDLGTNDLILDTNGTQIALISDGIVNNGKMGLFKKDGAVELYYDNNLKFETLTGGAKVTGDLQATGSGTFVNLINTGTYSDSSGDVGSAGQILSSTGSGTNWINDPNPTPYTWIIEADSGAGSPYTVQTGDTIDFVGVGNVDTAWDNSSKELRISLGGTSISGTGADTQVVYWTGAQTVSGDAGMVYNDTSNNLTVSGTVQAGTLSDGTFSGSSGTYTGGVSITSTDFVGALTGNATTATSLASSGAITLTGDTTSTGGPHTYTSGGAVTIPTTIASTTVTAKVLTNLPSPTSVAIAASDTILAAMAKLQGQITGIPQGLVYQGTWNANTNTPTLSSGTGTTGYFYIVSVAGSTNLDGITDWEVGDWAIFIEQGANDQWEKIDNSQSITGSGATNKITKWTAPTVLGTGLIEDDGTDVTIGNSGNLIVEGNTTLGNADSDTTTVKGPAHFEETLRADVGISLGNATYGTAGQVLTSGGGAATVNTWTTPTTGTVTSVATNNGLTGGTITTTGTLGILTVGTSNAIEFLSSATPASGDLVWFSDINDSNTLRKCTVADLQGPIGGPFLPLAGGTMTGDVIFNDDVKAKFGTSSDMSIFHNGSNSFIEQTGTGDLYIQQATDDKDIIFRCDTGGGGLATYFQLDGSIVKTVFSKATRHADAVEAYFGTGDDMFIKHTGSEGNIKNSTGNLYISQDANDADIIFESDNGSGGLATYLTIDGGDENIQFSKNGKFLDGVKAIFGNSNDLQIYHDGNNSKITEGGTGGLYIGSNLLGIQNNDHTEMMAQFTENGAVELYYDNSKKFETTTGGVSVTGSLSVSTTSSLVGDVSIGDTNSAFIGMLRAGANYIAATNAAGYLIFRTGGTTPTLTLGVNHDVRFDEYGSGTNSGTPTYNLEVDANGNVIETPSSGGGGGIFHGDQAVTTGSAALTFTLKRATTGTLIFDVWFTSETSTATSVAKKYVVAHSSNTTPVYNKILDTGPDGSNDFTVTFANATGDATGDSVTCSIQASGINQNIGYTVQVGYDSANTLTFTPAST
jgi:hypothetical protein